MANKATIVVFSGDYDKALAAMNIANGAAASGMDVTLFFCLWGTLLLKKRGQGGDNWMSKLFGVMERGGIKGARLSKWNMLGLGKWMFRRMMRVKGAAPLESLWDSAKEFGVRFLVCDLSLEVLGLKPEDLEGVDDFVGVGTYIKEAAESEITLFI